MENTDFVIENIDEEVKVIADNPSSVTNYPANTDFFIENIDANVISIAHSLNIEASEVDFRPANTDFFVLNIDNNVIKVAQSLGLDPSIVTLRPANTDFFIENIDANLILIAEYYNLEPSRVVIRPANTDMFIENIDRNVTLIKSKTNVVTVSGSFININVPDGGTMQLKQIYGNATQDGTPTPDSPVSIDVVTGEQTIGVTGKNLFTLDGKTFAGGTALSIDSTSSNSLSLSSTASAGNYSSRYVGYSLSELGLRVGDTFTLSMEITGTYTGAKGASMRLYWNNNTGSIIGVLESDSQPLTLTIPSGTTSISFYWYVRRTAIPAEGSVATFTNIQLELGSTATTYEPYQGQSYTIDLDTLELAKIGTYQDRIYKEDGKWYIEKQVGKYDGITSGRFWDSAKTRVYIDVNGLMVIPPSDSSIASVMSDKYLAKTEVQVITNGEDGICISQGGYMSIRDASFTDQATAFSSVADTTVYYALATPTTTEITDETLLSQLNFIADIYEGINNISFIGTGAQGVIEVVINKN